MTAERINALRKTLPPRTAALFVSPANRRYFTGFPSDDGLLLVTPDTAVFLIDFRYYEKAKEQATGCETVLAEQTAGQLRERLEAEGITTLLVETDRMSVGTARRYRETLGVDIPEDDRLTDAVRELRAVKSPAELAAIRKAQAITDRAFGEILDRIRPGVTERELMLETEFLMRRLGSEGVAFDLIVLSGKNTSLPHGTPTDKPIAPGDFVTLDIGAVADGYCSDMTRTVAVGGVSEKQQFVYETVLSAQRAALAVIREGAVCREVDAAARDLIDGAGFAGRFGHGLGHGVGLEIHEYPAFNTRCETALRSGTVITVEPGIYLAGEFGVRIEDLVAVTRDGCENLTVSPKELLIL